MRKRVPPLEHSEMTVEQRAVAADIAGARSGKFAGPFAIWIRVPEIAKRINHLSDRLRKNSRLDKSLVDLMILTLSRAWNSQYSWSAHVDQALALGIDQENIDALKADATPRFADPKQELMYTLCCELEANRALSDATYARALETFGEEALIELIATAGLYTMIAMTLAVFDVPSGSESLSTLS